MAFSGAEIRAQSNYPTPYTFTTLAGQSLFGSADGTGSAARFFHPQGVAVDATGNLYVADTNNHTIRKITAGGVVTTLVGSPGNSGSTDGLGGAARFFGPSGVAVDATGNLYVADTANHTIRKITAAGVVTTLAGSPGVCGSTDGTGGAARFNSPVGLAVDGAGNLYVADTANNTIRKITAAGVVTTLAGSPGASGSADGTGSAARFWNPQGVTVDGTGNVYVADTSNNMIRKVTAGGVTTMLAGSTGFSSNPDRPPVVGSADGTGSAAQFYHPAGVAVDGVGNLYVADTYNDTIRQVTAGGVVTTLAGSAGVTGSADGTGSAARFNIPSGVAVDGAGNLYVADYSNTIRRITAIGVVTTLAGSVGGSGSSDGTGSAARFYSPSGVAVDGSGNAYVADTFNNTIRKITVAGVVTTLAGSPGASGSANGTGSAARFNNPSGVAVDGAGNLYVCELFNHTIRKITAIGVVTTLAGIAGAAGSVDGTGSNALFNYPTGVSVDRSGNIYVADSNNHTIRKVTAGGVVSTLAGSPGQWGSADGTGSAARFHGPGGVAVDGSGNVYVSDYSNHTIRKITAAGAVTTLAGSPGNSGSADGTGSAARFYYPADVAVDGTGNVYVADSNNHTIRKITAAGVVTTLAGSPGVFGSADGTGSAARFYSPNGVAVDGAGNVYVGEGSNNTIRKGFLMIAPALITHPQSQGLPAGQNARFIVTASGNPMPTFLWQISADSGTTWTSLSDSSIYSGSATANLTVTNATVSLNGDQFQCVATNAAGSATSNPATLSVTKGTATVMLDSLSQAYTGSAVGATATTSPNGLNVMFTYNGSVNVPTAPGSYRVVATISDANYLGTASGTLIIQPNIAAYQAQYFSSGQLADPTVSGPSANPAHDGMDNLLKYAFGLDPTLVDSAAGLPIAGQCAGALTLSYIRRHDISDLTYTVEVSSDLVTWQSGPSYTQELSVTPLDAQRDQVLVTDLAPLSGSVKRFIRLRVTQP